MSLTIEILCSSPEHPVNAWLERWIAARASRDTVRLIHDKDQISSGDLLFLIAVTELIDAPTLGRFTHNAVIHSSDLPEGRGWSPQVWSILDGAREIVVSGLAAAKAVDSGPIWIKQTVEIPPHFVHDEINAALFETWCNVMTTICDMVEARETPTPQDDRPATYWPRRTPKDSALDPHDTIANQFDLMRVCDPDRYPAYFEMHGHTYAIRLEKRHDDS